MTNLLEITGEDVARLDDSELRSLIGLLCEADFRRAKLPCSGITWGGHQDAADGGLDVAVRGDTPPPPQSFVPRSPTGFQVKASSMGPAAITAEMCPGGELRESIRSLIRAQGAYIIVSSGDSTTDSSLENRIAAMRSAIAGEEGADGFHVDFFDRGRIATWLRNHPSLVLKVRSDIGRPVTGWQPYGNWSASPSGIADEFIVDDGLRLHDRRSSSGGPLSVEQGVTRLRHVLSAPGGCVRLAGLSGTGKTRLVQALFDDRLASDALDPTLVVYTDMSDKPVPDPPTMAEQLISERHRAIMVVDNCPPELHNQVARRCSGAGSTVSAVTVEYDVRDNLPDETEVFRLEPASEDTIEKLVSRRYPHITQVDARTIAEFSGGNARVAIALANTVLSGETLSGFRDAELFERLFMQRNTPDQGLLQAAQVCSLVYSFEGTDTQTYQSELGVLGALIDRSASDLYRAVATLRERDLVQARDVWRAVLPHAVANRLAKRALTSIPRDVLVDTFLSGSERILRSFSRRLSYLHDSDEAVALVRTWLQPEGWLGRHVPNLNQLGLDVLTNTAPVCPVSTLTAIERVAEADAEFVSQSSHHSESFIRLIRHLAYDDALFTRSAELLTRFALAGQGRGNRNVAQDELSALYRAFLSGTRATVERRAAFIEALLGNEDANRQVLGLACLDSALEAWHFSSAHEFGFGARPRDFGYQPETPQEIEQWYGTFIKLAVRFSLSDGEVATKVRKVLADNLRGLWTKAGVLDLLDDAIRKSHERLPWSDGWIALRGIIRFDASGFPDAVRARLEDLENVLRPNDLLQQARTFALSTRHGTFDLADGFDEDDEDASAGYERVYETTRHLGEQVAEDEAVLAALLPEIVSAHSDRLFVFGEGLAAGAADRRALWERLCGALENTLGDQQCITVLRGFLIGCEKVDREFAAEILDGLLSDPLLGQWFPAFQIFMDLDARALERLLECLDLGRAPAHLLHQLAYGRMHEALSDNDLAALLEKIVVRDDGPPVATLILSMRFHGKEKDAAHCTPRLMTVARDLLCSISYPRETRGHDGGYDLARIADVCLPGPDGEDTAREMCRTLAAAIEAGMIYGFDCGDLLRSIASCHPSALLDTFLSEEYAESYRLHRFFRSDFERHENPLNRISEDELLAWCDQEPARRYGMAVEAVRPFESRDGCERLVWTRFIERVFERAPDLGSVLEKLSDCIRPRAWSGSLADILEKRVVLFEDLFDHENQQVSAWARERYRAAMAWIDSERERDEQRRREQFESFE